MGHVTQPHPFQGRFVVRMLGLATTDLCTKFKIFVLAVMAFTVEVMLLIMWTENHNMLEQNVISLCVFCFASQP